MQHRTQYVYYIQKIVPSPKHSHNHYLAVETLQEYFINCYRLVTSLYRPIWRRNYWVAKITCAENSDGENSGCEKSRDEGSCHLYYYSNYHLKGRVVNFRHVFKFSCVLTEDDSVIIHKQINCECFCANKITIKFSSRRKLLIVILHWSHDLFLF